MLSFRNASRLSKECVGGMRQPEVEKAGPRCWRTSLRAPSASFSGPRWNRTRSAWSRNVRMKTT